MEIETIGNHSLLNCDTNEGMEYLIKNNTKVDYVLTSPPYNAHRNDFYNGNIKINDSKTQEDYENWIISHFKLYEKLLKKNGVVIYNINYMSSKANNMSNLFKTLLKIEEETNFIIIEQLCWKKKTGVPSKEARLTRVWENIFIFIRKQDWESFHDNYCKILTGKPNYIEAPNNDFKNDINKACFSSEMVYKMLKLYGASKESVVLDNFMGTGTTSIGCEKIGCKSIGIELDNETYDFSKNRIREFIGDFKNVNYYNLFNM